MNEQLIVKNFGPIKDATVDFKRVTVFIGPTGGGKSTLAKLKDILLYGRNYSVDDVVSRHPRFDSLQAYKEHSVISYFRNDTYFNYNSKTAHVEYKNGNHYIGTKAFGPSKVFTIKHSIDSLLEKAKTTEDFEIIRQQLLDETSEMLNELNRIETGDSARENFPKLVAPVAPWYIPSERVFVSSLEYSWPGLLRDDIGLPKNILDFANNFSTSRQKVIELNIAFLKVIYLHRNGQDFIKIPESEILLRLYETASGIQSVTPLLVLLEHLSRNTEQAQSFIIEEPELNLYPTAQQGLLNWLVEKCTKGENDLTITTHSPYILSSCNLLLEAYKVAQLRPDLEEEIAAIVPKACWLNPDEFAAYYVADGTVKPITDDRTHLIGGNELDAVSGDISDSFRKLLRLKKQAV
jgi:predicted ATPase